MISLKVKNYRRRELDWYRRRGLCVRTGCDIAVGTGKGGLVYEREMEWSKGRDGRAMMG